MTANPATCRPDDTLESADHQMWEHDCGVLPVIDHQGRLGSTITDRDICMGAYTQGAGLADLRVADSMSKQLVTCHAGDTAVSAARTMAEHRVRRLPVVDDHDELCGMLSLNDLATKAVKDKAVGREIVKVLTAVCQPQTKRDLVADAAVGESASAGAQL